MGDIRILALATAFLGWRYGRECGLESRHGIGNKGLQGGRITFIRHLYMAYNIFQ